MSILGGATKSKFALIVVTCLLATVAAQEPWGDSQKPRALVYALEGLGALGGALGCSGLCLGPVFLTPVSASWEDSIGYAVGVVAAVCIAASTLPAAAGMSAAKVGEQLGEDGSQASAIVGAYGGAFFGVAFILAGGLHRTNAVRVPCYVLGGLCVPAGAVVGYNLGTPRAAGSYRSGFGGRLQPPGVALTSTELPDRSVEYGVKVQLAGLRL